MTILTQVPSFVPNILNDGPCSVIQLLLLFSVVAIVAVWHHTRPGIILFSSYVVVLFEGGHILLIIHDVDMFHGAYNTFRLFTKSARLPMSTLDFGLQL